jgi:hypothetical protein
MLLVSTTAYAGPVQRGTWEIAGVSGLLFNIQTLSPEDEDEDIDFNSGTVVFDTTFYASGNLGLGVALGFNRLKFEAPDNSSFEVTSTIIGPQAKLRFGGERADLVIVGGGGYSSNKVSAEGPDIEEDAEFDSDGFFWQAGAHASIFMNDLTSFDLGARYQSSSISDEDDVKLDVSGMIITVGFSIYFH